MKTCEYCDEGVEVGHTCDNMPIGLQNGIRAIGRVFGQDTAPKTGWRRYASMVTSLFRRIFQPRNTADLISGYAEWRQGR